MFKTMIIALIALLAFKFHLMHDSARKQNRSFPHVPHVDEPQLPDLKLEETQRPYKKVGGVV